MVFVTRNTGHQPATKGRHMLYEVYIPSCRGGFKTLTIACNDSEIGEFLRLLMDKYEKMITAKKIKMGVDIH
jgi:hypothetical protein